MKFKNLAAKTVQKEKKFSKGLRSVIITDKINQQTFILRIQIQQTFSSFTGASVPRTLSLCKS